MSRFTRRQIVAAGAAAPLLGLPRIGQAQTPMPSGLLPATLPTGGMQPDGTWAFTDDLGVTVGTDAMPVKIAAQVSLAAALWDYGIEVAAYYSRGRDEDGNPLPAAGNLPVQDIPRLDEGGEIDLELMIELGIDCAVGHNYGIEAGGIWPIDDAILARMRERVPVLAVAFADGADAKRTIEAMRNVAIALGADVDTAENVTAADAFLTNSAALQEAIAANAGLTALFISGSATGFWISGFDTPDIRYFASLGLDVVPDPALGELSWEAFPTYAADLIFNDERVPNWWSVAQLTAEVPTFTAHPAIAASQVTDWRAVYIPSYQGFTPILEATTAAIAASRGDVV